MPECKRPWGGPQPVRESLSRSTPRVAMSHPRRRKVEQGRGSCRWQHSRQGGPLEETSLEVWAWIRRFLRHVLPPGECKIRSSGLLARRHRHTLGTAPDIVGGAGQGKAAQSGESAQRFAEWCGAWTGIEPGSCPYGTKGRVLPKDPLRPVPP